MKCEKCGQDIKLKVGSKINSKGCKVLTNITTILTIQCNNCRHVFQAPIQSKSFMSLEKD